MTQLREVICERDGITDDDFDDILHDILECETDGDGFDSFCRDPDEILRDYFCIEADFFVDLVTELFHAADGA